MRHLRGVGYRVVEVDIRPGYRADYIVADINHPVDLLGAFDLKPDVVFLLSAIVSRVTCEQAGGLSVATNVSGTNNILQLCHRSNSMLVFFSTSEVYGPHCEIMDETMSVPEPNNRYGLSKYIGEMLVEYEVRNSGLRAVVLRPFMMYDEEEHFGDHRSAMVRFVGNLSLGLPIEVHRGGVRAWLHASDAVRAIEAAAHVDAFQIINIGHPESIGIEELVELIRRRLCVPRELIKITELPPRMTLRKIPRLEKQSSILGVQPQVSLDEGVHRVCTRIPERLAAGERWR